MKLLNNDPLLSQQQQVDGPMHKNNSIAASSSSSSSASSSSLLKPDVLQLSRCPPIHSLLNKNHDDDYRDDDEAPPHKELTSHQEAYSNSFCFGFFSPYHFVCLVSGAKA
jgi:hypothetical protein